MALPEIIIYSKPGCCLCERAMAQLKRLQEKHQFSVHEINIVNDLALYRRFKDEIPVIFVDGEKAFKYHLDEEQFIRLLESARLRRGADHPTAS